jgi:antitoxin component of MazEF toxin-antitoxin module
MLRTEEKQFRLSCDGDLLSSFTSASPRISPVVTAIQSNLTLVDCALQYHSPSGFFESIAIRVTNMAGGRVLAEFELNALLGSGPTDTNPEALAETNRLDYHTNGTRRCRTRFWYSSYPDRFLARKRYTLTVHRWTNSLVVGIPAAVAKSAHFKVGQPIKVSAEGLLLRGYSELLVALKDGMDEKKRPFVQYPGASSFTFAGPKSPDHRINGL